jgi:5-(carboxyamino)imidazole ribonucleotide mutase
MKYSPTHDGETCNREALHFWLLSMAKSDVSRSPKSSSSKIPSPLVGVIMGSTSDLRVMQFAAQTLKTLQVPFEERVVSAHRTPRLMVEYAAEAQHRGLRVLIAGAGGAAHLPGMVASLTPLPVLGVPVESSALSGLDSLLSIVQMPAGVPVGTMALGRAGAVNAALMAARILASDYPSIAQALEDWRVHHEQSAGDPAAYEKASQDAAHQAAMEADPREIHRHQALTKLIQASKGIVPGARTARKKPQK